MVNKRNGNGVNQLTDEQAAEVRRLYLNPSQDPRPKVIAKRIGAKTPAVKRLVATLASDRLLAIDQERAANEYAANAKALGRVERDADMDRRASDVGALELELRRSLLSLARQAVDEMTPKEAIRSLRYLASSKDSQFVERLAANRTTDRMAIEDVSERWNAQADALIDAMRTLAGTSDDAIADADKPADADAEAAQASAGGAGGVVSEPQVDAAPRAKPNPPTW